jgi:hypothetical protein
MQAKQDKSLRYAFANQYNLILLAGAAGLSLALESSIPLLAGLLGELLWLLIAPSTPSFRSWAAEQVALQHRSRVAADTAQATRRLDEPYVTRVQTLAQVVDDVRRLADERALDPMLFGPDGDRLHGAVHTLIKMSLVHQRLSRFLAGSQSSQIEEEVVRLGRALAAEKDPGVRLSLKQALTVGQRRLKQHEQIESTRRALEAKMKTLELSLDYLRSQVFSGTSEVELVAQLDEIVSGATFVSDLEAEANAAMVAPRTTGRHSEEVPA